MSAAAVAGLPWKELKGGNDDDEEGPLVIFTSSWNSQDCNQNRSEKSRISLEGQAGLMRLVPILPITFHQLNVMGLATNA